MVGDSSNPSERDRSVSTDTSVDAVMDLLTDERRRHVLECLRDRDVAITLPDLAQDVAVRESAEPRTAIEPETIRTVATSLHHLHVPKLAAAGVVEYDPDRKLVAANPDESIDRATTLADSLRWTGDEM